MSHNASDSPPNRNPGNFANRDREEVIAAAMAGGHGSGPGTAGKYAKAAEERVHGGGGGGGEDSGGGGGGGEPDVVEYEDDEEEDGGGDTGGGGGGKSKRGFASMPREKVQEIARKGGKASGGGQSS